MADTTTCDLCHGENDWERNERCPACYGEGCKRCDMGGAVLRISPCPNGCGTPLVRVSLFDNGHFIGVDDMPRELTAQAEWRYRMWRELGATDYRPAGVKERRAITLGYDCN